MQSDRLEAFSDGVLAIIITILVLELNVPEGDTLHELWETTGLSLLTYLLSFVYIGIYWNNHHHLFNVVDRVDGAVPRRTCICCCGSRSTRSRPPGWTRPTWQDPHGGLRSESARRGLAYVEPWLGVVPFVAVAAMWLVPDRRVERYLEREGGAASTG
jgi:hypothetical protein